MNDNSLSRKFMEVIPRTMQSFRTEIRDSARSELTTPQFRVLVHLFDGPLSNSELARRIGVSVPAMSRMVDTLVRRGYLLREPSKDDRRQVFLQLSAAGRRKVAALRAETQARISEHFAALDSRQRKALAEGLSVLELLYGHEAPG